MKEYTEELNMAESPINPLISSKPSDSGLHVQLHPLALLTISDHITRHAARQQQGQIVGALLGQQNGREISLEYAFECQTIAVLNGDILLHQAWFDERVKQCRTSQLYVWQSPEPTNYETKSSQRCS